jgi:hypothetical protein
MAILKWIIVYSTCPWMNSDIWKATWAWLKQISLYPFVLLSVTIKRNSSKWNGAQAWDDKNMWISLLYCTITVWRHLFQMVLFRKLKHQSWNRWHDLYVWHNRYKAECHSSILSPAICNGLALSEVGPSMGDRSATFRRKPS